ncbi:MAG: hypothetical protein WC975_13770 [Phycisphaerae bacterium]
MRNKPLLFGKLFSAVTIGGSGGGQPLPLVIVTLIVLAMALITVVDSVLPGGGIDTKKQIPFQCTSCNSVVKYTIGELQKMQDPSKMGPMMGPLVLDCPSCKKHSLTQAVECPQCNAVFIIKMNPAQGQFDDKCPKCETSFAKAWQEKYRKENGE